MKHHKQTKGLEINNHEGFDSDTVFSITSISMIEGVHESHPEHVVRAKAWGVVKNVKANDRVSIDDYLELVYMGFDLAPLISSTFGTTEDEAVDLINFETISYATFTALVMRALSMSMVFIGGEGS